MRGVGMAAAIAAGVLLTAGTAAAEISDGKVKIGVLTDLSGGYEQNSGNGSVEAVKMAAEEFGYKVNGMPIEIVAGDHKNKPDIGVSIVNRWFDLEQVDAVTDLVNSSVAFAVLEAAKAKNRTVLLTAAGSADFTGKACAPDHSVQWVFDTYEAGNALGEAVKELGKTWFFVTADYVFGKALQEGMTAGVTSHGGTVVGSVLHPLGTQDFSSFLLQAQASKAEVIAIANGGDDTVNAVKAAKEFGIIGGGQKIMAGFELPAIHAASLEVAQGITYVSPWIPTLSPAAQAFTDKFIARRGSVPSSFHVGAYSVVRQYLMAVQATNSDDPKPVIGKMRTMPVNDAFATNGRLRPDGRMVHDVYLVRIKSPAESRGEWDLLQLVATIPGDKAFRPIEQGGCPLLPKE
jgi:branched-chain amino acid transport system substrate-binding protein